MTKHDQMLALVEHFKDDQPVTQDMQSTMLADEMQLAADAITALLEENATLRTEKHADAEAIGALRESLSAMLDLQDNASPFGGEMYQDRVDRVFDQCRAALRNTEANHD